VERFLNLEGTREGLPQLPDGHYARVSALTEAERVFGHRVESKWPDRKVIAARGIGPPGLVDRTWPITTMLHKVLPAALATGRLSIRSDAVAAHLLTDTNTGQANVVACIDRLTNRVFDVFGRVIVLCASTLETVRLLLNSKSPCHPAGLGNSSGTLGRFLCDHMTVQMGGTLEDECGRAGRLGGPCSLVVPKFRNLRSERADFVRGYGVWGALNRSRQPVGAGKRAVAEFPSWFLHALLEVLPDKDNRATIDENKEDVHGIKTLKIKFGYASNEFRMKADAVNCMDEMTHVGKLRVSWRSTTIPGEYVHELGGARMGRHPSCSVVNRFNQCWDARNVFVLDGSCFVTSGWQNPSLTMMAIAVRGCAYLVHELARGNL